MDHKFNGFNSKLIHGGEHHDELGSAITPIYQTSTFRFNDSDHGARLFAGEEQGYIYTRIGKAYRDWETDRKSTRLNSSHSGESRMPSSA